MVFSVVHVLESLNFSLEALDLLLLVGREGLIFGMSSFQDLQKVTQTQQSPSGCCK